MKRAFLCFLSLATPLVLGACGEDAGKGAATSSAAEALLETLPREAIGVFFVDVRRVMDSPLATKAMEEKGGDLVEFTEMTGVDPTRDISAMAGAIMEAGGGQETEAAVVMRVTYDQEQLLARMEEEHGELATEIYRDVTLVTLPHDPGEDVTLLAFLDESTVAMGTPDEVRAVIDVHGKHAESIKKNESLMAVVEEIDRSALFWAAALISEEAAQELSEGNAMLKNLSGLRSLMMSIDFKDQMLNADVGLRSDNQEQNTQIADFLVGMKSFAAMGASDSPELAEVLRKITITSGPNEVRIVAAIPEELLLQLEDEAD